MRKDEYIVLGKIVNTHGVKGKLRVKPYVDSLDQLINRRTLKIRDSQNNIKEYTVKSAGPHKNFVLVKIRGVNNLEQAQSLLGCDIVIERKELETLPKGEYFWVDIIGMKVFTLEGKELGVVKSIFRTGSNDIYVVESKIFEKEKEILIPAIEDVVKKVDLEKNVIIVDLVEGLL